MWLTWLTRDHCNPKVPSSIPAGGKDFPWARKFNHIALCLGRHIKVRVPGATIARKNTCVIITPQYYAPSEPSWVWTRTRMSTRKILKVWKLFLWPIEAGKASRACQLGWGAVSPLIFFDILDVLRVNLRHLVKIIWDIICSSLFPFPSIFRLK